MELRLYQKEAIEAVEAFLKTRTDNPCVVLPTGAGKSYVIAEIIRRKIEVNPDFRCIVLAHRQELVEQNHEALSKLLDVRLIGVYCNGINRRETDRPVTFAMINSVRNRVSEFKAFDMVLVDEAHHIPLGDEEGMYGRVIAACKRKNPSVRVVGFTATPYRLKGGYVCDRDYVLNEVCYEANVADLIKQGYLCELRSKISQYSPKLKDITECGGDYNLGELGERVRDLTLVRNAVGDAIGRLNSEERKCCVWFCVDIKHCEMVYSVLVNEQNEKARYVTSGTPDEERKQIIMDFKAGNFRHLLNVGVFTEGFNVPQIDAVVLLRPTLSRGLYVQMVGRGLRKHDNKSDCIILDYAKCISRHGPIDQGFNCLISMEVCPNCNELFARARKVCPKCGYAIPDEICRTHNERDVVAKRARNLHSEIAALDDILSKKYNTGRTLKVLWNKDLINNKMNYFVKKVCVEAYETLKVTPRYNRPIPTEEWERFQNEFFEYAQDVELTSLSQMLKEYFEYPYFHKSEDRIRKRNLRQIAAAQANAVMKRQLAELGIVL